MNFQIMESSCFISFISYTILDKNSLTYSETNNISYNITGSVCLKFPNVKCISMLRIQRANQLISQLSICIPVRIFVYIVYCECIGMHDAKLKHQTKNDVNNNKGNHSFNKNIINQFHSRRFPENLLSR